MNVGTDNKPMAERAQMALWQRLKTVLPLVACSLPLAACVTAGPRNQAPYTGYAYRVVLQDVRESACRYGPYRTTYPDVPERRSEEFVGGTVSLWDGTVFKNLTCTWKTLDGTQRTESVDMQTLMANKLVKWDFTDVEVHRNQPLVMSPDVRVELRNRIFRITIRAMVQYYGEYLSSGARHIPYRTVTNTLLERTGE